MIIDVHGHVVAPMELYAYQANLISSRGAHGRGKSGITDEKLLSAVSTHSGEPRKHVQILDDFGTDLQFISPRPYASIHSIKPEKIVRWYTEEVNNVIAGVCRVHPGRFRGIAGLPQNAGISPKNTLDEVERCIKELGFVGVMLNPDPHEGLETPPGLGDEYWYPLYEKLVELDVPAVIHSASCLSPRESYSLHFINEESIAVMSLLDSRVFEDFPRLKIVVCHGGGAIPYHVGRFIAGRIRAKHSERFEDALRKLYFDTCLYTQEALELLIKVAGPQNCLFGTENPGTGSVIDPKTGKYMDDIKTMIESIEWLSAEEKQLIFEGNAKRLFKI